MATLVAGKFAQYRPALLLHSPERSLGRRSVYDKRFGYSSTSHGYTALLLLLDICISADAGWMGGRSTGRPAHLCLRLPAGIACGGGGRFGDQYMGLINSETDYRHRAVGDLSWQLTSHGQLVK